ncbi:MAG TPA: DoxX family protein [Longimicrobiales bacterium]
MSTVTGSTKHAALGLMVLRVAVGLAFVAHGAQKLFVFGLAGVTGAFGHMGIPLPGVTGALVLAVELLGGLALAFGLLTRLASLGLAIDMLGAIALVHARNGFFLPNGFEYAFTLLAATAALTLAGPGALALDNVLGRKGEAEEEETTTSSSRPRVSAAA